MADPDPNPNVNLAGSGVVLHVQRPDGELVPVQGTDAGARSSCGLGASFVRKDDRALATLRALLLAG